MQVTCNRSVLQYFQMGSYIIPHLILSQSDSVSHVFSDIPLIEIPWHIFPSLPLFPYWTLWYFFSPTTINNLHGIQLLLKGLLCFLWYSIIFFDHSVLFLTFEITSSVKTNLDCTWCKSSHIENPIQVNPTTK